MIILGFLRASASPREKMEIIFRSLTRSRGDAEKTREKRIGKKGSGGYLGFLFLAFSRARSSSATIARFSSSTRPFITRESSSNCFLSVFPPWNSDFSVVEESFFEPRSYTEFHGGRSRQEVTCYSYS